MRLAASAALASLLPGALPASASAGGGTFAIETVLPSNASFPSNKEYVAVGAVDPTSLPSGTTFLRLVIVDPGCGSAIAMPMAWAPVPSTQHLMFSPVNYSSPWNAFGTTQMGGLPGCPGLKGVVTVKAEAWSARRLPQNDTAGKKLGESSPLEVHFDYSLTAASFSNFSVTATGPGEGDVEFFPASDDAATIKLATQLGGYFFVRVWPCIESTTNKCPPTATYPGGAATHAEARSRGMPVFKADAFDGQQMQTAAPKFRVAWSQPGTYYFGLSAWAGQTCHNVVQSPMDGVHTAAFPQISNVFQPVAIIVPFENGTTIPTPPGFQGPTFTLPKIVGNKRVALSKRNLTFFNGAHWYLPTELPISSAPSQCGVGCVAAAPAAVDIELPHGVTLDNASGFVHPLPMPSAASLHPRGADADSRTTKTHSRVRILCNESSCGTVLPLGVLLAPDVIGQTLQIGFRALDNEHLNQTGAGIDIDSWVHANARMVERPNARTPQFFSTGLTYGLSLATWPSDAASGVTPLDTYRRLGLNTVSDHAWHNKTNRTGWSALGMRYGPEAGCPFAIPTMSVAAANATNVSALCPGLTPDQVELEHEKIVAAARFYSTASVNDPTTGSGNDIGFDGCARKIALTKFQASVLQGSDPDVLYYDWEGWTDMEHWVKNVQNSENAQRQRLPGESQADLAYRLATSWLDDLIGATKAVSANTMTSMFGGWAADNKGCCSGSKLGIFDWRALRKHNVYSNPGWYSGQKNLRLLAKQVRREKEALGPNYQVRARVWGWLMGEDASCRAPVLLHSHPDSTSVSKGQVYVWCAVVCAHADADGSDRI
jgi:hypothetical protein